MLQSALARELLARKERLRGEVKELRAMEEDRSAAMRGMGEDMDRLEERSRATRKAIREEEAKARTLQAEAKRLRATLAKRREEVEQCRARNEALEKDHLPAHVAVANRRRLQVLQDRHAGVQFKLRQAREREELIQQDAEGIRSEQHHLQTQMEIVEQAVASMHSTVDATAAELLRPSAAAGSGHAFHHRRSLKGRGTGPDVPVFLRYEGMVRHVPFSKGDVELLIKALWALYTMSSQRRAQLGEPELSLAEFFHRYTTKLFPRHDMRIEFCYNFVAGLHQYLYDADVEMFFKTLFDEISEHFYYDQIAMAAHLKKLLEDMDVVDGCRDGLILKEVFFAGLRMFFPHKEEPEFQTLAGIVLRNDLTRGQVDINKLLLENAEGDQSEFVEEVRDQYLSEVFQFPGTLQAALHAADTDGTGTLTAGQVAAVLQEVDPNKPAHEVREYMQRGTGLAEFDDSTPVRIDEYTTRLQRDLVHRSGHWNSDVDVEALRRVARETLSRRHYGGMSSVGTASAAGAQGAAGSLASAAGGASGATAGSPTSRGGAAHT